MEPAKLQEKNQKIKEEFSGTATGFALDRSELQKINEPEEILPAHVLHMKTPHFSFAVG